MTTRADPAPVVFESGPAGYHHWTLAIDGPVATLGMRVQEDRALSPDDRLKLNSYDLGVDIGSADAVEQIRSDIPRCTRSSSRAFASVFCAGANIIMLRESSHRWKVSLRKFTNERVSPSRTPARLRD